MSSIALLGIVVVILVLFHIRDTPPSHIRLVNRHTPDEIDDDEIRELAYWLKRHAALAKTSTDLFQFWNYKDPNNLEWINFMSTLTRFDGRVLAPHVLPLVREPVIDVGGNNGMFARQLGINTTVWDQPHVVANSSYTPSVGGNFLIDPTPSGFKTAIFKSVLHDLSPSESQQVLHKVAAAVKRIIIIEVMQPIDTNKLTTTYFAHLQPFKHLFRKPHEYISMLQKEDFVLRRRFTKQSVMYTILAFDRRGSFL